jgi:hypothetical protein
MTLSEINTALTEYANEDISIVKENTAMCITDTNIGIIDLYFENSTFEAYVGGELLLNTESEQEVRSFLINNYSIEITS